MKHALLKMLRSSGNRYRLKGNDSMKDQSGQGTHRINRLERNQQSRPTGSTEEIPLMEVLYNRKYT